MSGLDSASARPPFFPPLGSTAGTTEPGISEFDSFIHSDLCSGMSGTPEPPLGNNMNFMSSTFPMQPGIAPTRLSTSPSPESLPSLSLEWSNASASSSGSATAISAIDVLANPSDRALRIPAAAPIAESVAPYQFNGNSLWPQQSSSVVDPSPFTPMICKSEEGAQAANFSQLMLTKPENCVTPQYWYREGESVPGSALIAQKRGKSDSDQSGKRLRAHSTAGSPELTPSADAPKSSTPSREGPARPPPRKSSGSRRPPPSASQITEAGQPFPVIDTSAKHSSLFIPPDTSGLTKREARLVKNRAAAFLSRQRKREQFEELGGKCKIMARLVWMLYDAYTQTFAAGIPYESVMATTPLGATLKHEPDDIRHTLEQVVHKQGAVAFEGIGDDRSTTPAPAPRPDRHSEQLTAELAALRAENKALRAKLEANNSNESSPESRAVVPARNDMQSAFVFMLMIALNLARVPASAPESSSDSLVKSGVVSELLGEEDASGSVVRMSVAPPSTGEPLLCSLMIESAAEDDADSKRARSTTPDGAQQCDGSSEASAPSLLSAHSDSPAPSSLSSASSTRRVRRVIAFSTGADAVAVDAPPLAAFDMSILRELESVDLGPWLGEHAASLNGGDTSHAATSLRERLAGKVDLSRGFFLVASSEDGGGDTPHLSLYARAGSKAEPTQVVRVLAAAKEALTTLERSANTDAEHLSIADGSLCSTPVTCAAAARKRRDAGVFQLTYHP
ncbi:hypothetical protein MCUN1_001756 [Malassezia cuniculi]|uniref:BZIP domain-containing protein n=1 Tax=Malassezia cuniculi TaxID=948313 RepID=A0AAF0EQV5_9BASI|nr:hypothetical protein MCUN1_001756 [Malassezia cuniculi]